MTPRLYLANFLRWFSTPSPARCEPDDHVWSEFELSHAPYFDYVEVRKCLKCGEAQESYLGHDDIEPIDPLHEVRNPLPSRWRKAS